MNYDPNALYGVLPALILSAGALLLLTSEVFLRTVRPGVPGRGRGPAGEARRQPPPGSDAKPQAVPAPPDRRYQAWVAAAFAAAALWAALSRLGDPAVSLFSGAAASDGFARVVAAVVCAALLFSCIVAFSYLESLRATRGEFYALALFSAAGMCLLAQATDLIVIFISLEVMSLAVYALCAYLRRGKRPAEAAFKYFILGSFASAIFLYGAALAFGATGSTRLADVAAALRSGGPSGASGLLYASVALLTSGFAFKVAAVPFHMWVPDVYDGAPAPVTGFMAAGVKAAAFAVLVRILVTGFGDASTAIGPHGWRELVSWLALLTVFRAAVEAGLTPLAVFGVLTSVAGLYYYLRVVVYVYMHPQAKPEAVQGGRLLSAGLAVAGCALLVLWLGVQPGSFAVLTQ